ncbi:hypothetical protein V8687_23530 (plasmid) [Shewanella baltica]|uniref:hypothetical protein n=1 Tax=Shewanella baltica TaxID=62322 RepID=UPI0030D0B4C3
MWKILKIALVFLVMYYVLSFYMTQSRIAEFSGMNSHYGVARSNMIAVSDLAAENLTFTHKQQICHNITSSRGMVTLSFVNDVTVCCDTSEWLVPYRNVGSNREYMCGKWPRIEIVYQPLKTTKLQLGLIEP